MAEAVTCPYCGADAKADPGYHWNVCRPAHFASIIEQARVEFEAVLVDALGKAAEGFLEAIEKQRKAGE